MGHFQAEDELLLEEDLCSFMFMWILYPWTPCIREALVWRK